MRFGEQSKEIRPVVNFNGSRLLSSVVLGIEQFIAQEVGGWRRLDYIADPPSLAVNLLWSTLYSLLTTTTYHPLFPLKTT